RHHARGAEGARRRGRLHRIEQRRPVARRRAPHGRAVVALGPRRARAPAERAMTLEPLARLVHFDATDGVGLAGLLYEPRRATKRAAIWLHGTGGASIFDAQRTNG